MKRVAIIGAGPAGLFAAYELSNYFEVEIIEQGRDVDSRKCPVLDGKNCINCNPCNILSGLGGAGLFSDGKLNLNPKIGGDLTEFLPENKAWELIEYIDKIFTEHGVINHELNSIEELKIIKKRAAEVGINFIPIRQKHIGSDHLPEIIKNFRKTLEERGVKFHLNTKATDLLVKEKRVTEIVCNNKRISCDYAILATGRYNSEWVTKIAKKLKLTTIFNPVDIGVRVEVPSIVMESITKMCWDPKFHIRTPTYDDFVRTFCVCPNGFVTKETYEGFVGVNGYSMRDKKSENTNFAFLSRVKLTKPVENTTSYAVSMAKMATTIGGNKPIIQRLGDLKQGRRSTWSRINKSYVKPTLLDVTPGDISMALSHRIVTNILEGLKMLDKIIPGIFSDSTLLYAPEMKLYAMRIKTNKNLQTEIPNLFVAGDGAGVSRGIIGAAATGIIAARGIISLN